MNRLEQQFPNLERNSSAIVAALIVFFLGVFLSTDVMLAAGLENYAAPFAILGGPLTLIIVGSQDRRNRIIALVVLVPLGIGAYIYDIGRMLSTNNTVHDFKASDIETQVRYKLHMCDDGKCLFYVDWKCGFSNGDAAAVEQCFDDALKRVEPWEKLDRITKYCGVRSAEFVDTQFFSPSECQKAGGVWGIRSTVHLDLRSPS